MPNTYFQFKQFTVHQDRCAMKVCTDACLFGAWTGSLNDRWELINGSVNTRILDIGTGTGLLSLMLAQKINGMIDAVEIDAAAASQAAENFANSPWKERLSVINADARTIDADKRYDLIITNPPFFENDLKSADEQRNLALHSAALSLEALIKIITVHLADKGCFAVLLPYHREEIFEKIAGEAAFYLLEKVQVAQTEKHPFFRTMLLMGKEQRSCNTSKIVIRQGDVYSDEFSSLLSSYYLNL